MSFYNDRGFKFSVKAVVKGRKSNMEKVRDEVRRLAQLREVREKGDGVSSGG